MNLDALTPFVGLWLLLVGVPLIGIVIGRLISNDN